MEEAPNRTQGPKSPQTLLKPARHLHMFDRKDIHQQSVVPLTFDALLTTRKGLSSTHNTDNEHDHSRSFIRQVTSDVQHQNRLMMTVGCDLPVNYTYMWSLGNMLFPLVCQNRGIYSR